MKLRRCGWCGDDPLYITYHDREWGVPVRNDRKLFEFLVLEGMQAGLSWLTVLRKRENFRAALDDFDPERVARYTPARIRRLLADPGIIRNRRKLEATVGNARAFLAVRRECGSFSRYMWAFVEHRVIVNRRIHARELPACTPLSEAISRDMRRRGFRFVGPVILYAHMQATGMVNDHLVSCFRYRPLARAAHRLPGKH